MTPSPFSDQSTLAQLPYLITGRAKRRAGEEDDPYNQSYDEFDNSSPDPTSPYSPSQSTTAAPALTPRPPTAPVSTFPSTPTSASAGSPTTSSYRPVRGENDPAYQTTMRAISLTQDPRSTLTPRPGIGARLKSGLLDVANVATGGLANPILGPMAANQRFGREQVDAHRRWLQESQLADQAAEMGIKFGQYERQGEYNKAVAGIRLANERDNSDRAAASLYNSAMDKRTKAEEEIRRQYGQPLPQDFTLQPTTSGYFQPSAPMARPQTSQPFIGPPNPAYSPVGPDDPLNAWDTLPYRYSSPEISLSGMSKVPKDWASKSLPPTPSLSRDPATDRLRVEMNPSASDQFVVPPRAEAEQMGAQAKAAGKSIGSQYPLAPEEIAIARTVGSKALNMSDDELNDMLGTPGQPVSEMVHRMIKDVVARGTSAIGRANQPKVVGEGGAVYDPTAQTTIYKNPRTTSPDKPSTASKSQRDQEKFERDRTVQKVASQVQAMVKSDASVDDIKSAIKNHPDVKMDPSLLNEVLDRMGKSIRSIRPPVGKAGAGAGGANADFLAKAEALKKRLAGGGGATASGGGGGGGPKLGDTKTYQGATYKFDGKEWKRQ